MHRHIEGDLLELYAERRRDRGKFYADLRYFIDILFLFRPGIIRPAQPSKPTNIMSMYRNYLTVGWRSLLKSKVFSIINIAGLSLGLTCSIFIALWVNDEYQMNAYHDDIDRLYTVTSVEYSGTEVTGSYDTPGMLAEELKKVMPEVEYATNRGWNEWNTLAAGDKKLKIPGAFVSPDFFKMFSYPLIIGTKETVLKAADNVVISRSLANRLFGSPEAAMDKGVRFENYRDLKVTGVFEDIGDNDSEKFEYACHWDFFVERNDWVKVWHNSGPSTYIKLHANADAKAVAKKLQHFIKGYDKEYSNLDRLELGLQPYRETYLHGNFSNGVISGGKIEYVRLFSFVAVFILLIACINFMNLSTARAMKRAKEIGVRKVNGAMKRSLVTQFLFEAIMFTSIAVVISLMLVQLFLPSFNLLTGKNILSPLGNGNFWIGIVALTLIAGIAAGSYPAWLLSSFKALAVMKPNFRFGSNSGFFRQGLVVVQFGLSMIFIVGMIVVTRQVNYIQNKNLGYDRSNLIFIRLSGELGKSYPVFKNELLKKPGIESVTKMNNRPVELQNATGGVIWEGKDPNSLPNFTQAAVGYDFVKTIKANLIAGRDFSEEYEDSTNYIINESALKIIGYKDPIGMPLTFWGVKGTIVGVLEDFHFNSLHVAIEPLVLRIQRSGHWGYAIIRTEKGKTQEALASIETLHNKLNPEFPFAHQFADEEYAYLHRSEQVVKKLSIYFAVLAICISTLGLLGLIIFSAEQRTKEVGIRKVLGAGVFQLVTLLSKDFMKLVVLSTIISIPIAYYFMNKWLSNFEYHIDVQWWIFAIAASSALVIALFTVGLQAARAASANPVNSLRSE
jgi:putative ABC transport system permease protein